MRIAQKALLKIINLCAKMIVFDKLLDNKIDRRFTSQIHNTISSQNQLLD